ncbi:MAG: hypothetical protein WDW36_009131 [Sanguina aurantia]
MYTGAAYGPSGGGPPAGAPEYHYQPNTPGSAPVQQQGMAQGWTGSGGGGAPMAPMDVENQKTFAFAERSVRHGFVRKVFGIVAVQLALTVAFSAACLYVNPLRMFLQSQGTWLFYLAWGLSFALVLALGCSVRLRRGFPGNMLVLGLFTLTEAFLIGMITSFFNTEVVLLAFVTTAAAVTGIVLFSLQTKFDITGKDRAMAAILVAVILALLLVTALGIAGLASFWVQLRRRHIGIRRAIGATRGDILRYFQIENFLIVSFGIALGMEASAVATSAGRGMAAVAERSQRGRFASAGGRKLTSASFRTGAFGRVGACAEGSAPGHSEQQRRQREWQRRRQSMSRTLRPSLQNPILYDRPSVRDFGAVGDGVTDDTAHIQQGINAIANQGGGVLILPPGIFLVTATLTVNGNVSIAGSGSDITNLDTQRPNLLATSVLKWGGTTANEAPVLQQTGNQSGGFRWSDFAVDAANVAGVGVALDRAKRCIFSNIVISRTARCGLVLKPRTALNGDNCLFNLFENIQVRSNRDGVTLDSATATANVCHNSFVNLCIYHSGYALTMYNCDNNRFSMVWCMAAGGSTGADILLSSPLCRANYFYHSQGRISAVGGSYNAVWGYDRENGQRPPLVDATSRLFCQEHGSEAFLTREALSHSGLSAFVEGDWTPAFKMGQVDHCANILLSQTRVGGQLSASFVADGGAGRSAQLHCTTDGGTPGLCQSFGRGALGFFDAPPVTKRVVDGSRGGGAALVSLLAALSSLGLVVDMSTA